MYNIDQDDYKLVERPEDDFYTVQLLTGPYVDTKYQYGSVTAKVNDDAETASLAFKWTLIEGNEDLDSSAEFQNYIGEVLSHILQDAFDSGEYKIGSNDDTNDTNDGTKKSDQ